MSDSIAIRSNNVTELSTRLDFILLDGSISMMDKWWDMLSALDTYISTLKTEGVDTHVLLHVFDSHDLQLEARNTHIRTFVPFKESGIGSHWGSTPLYDAIVVMGQKIRDLNPVSGCTVTIVTDGLDTGNKFADEVQARAVLDWLRAQGYQVIFIGCDFDNDEQARALGASPSNCIGVRKELLSDATKSYAKKRAHNARSGADISFTEDEKTKFGGYLGYTASTSS